MNDFHQKYATAIKLHIDRAMASLAIDTRDSWLQAYESLDVAMGLISAEVHPLYNANDAGELVQDEAV